ncbi:hypothetical protein Adt_04622 [Abeliophyllum distichum]|uniref:Uncharacterized protein n=1 Tax=Abeliophyllum distichum TaxID=126358 RepID=A0ABD1V1U0_9LAMI
MMTQEQEWGESRRCAWECTKEIAPAMKSRPTASKKAGREKTREPRISKRDRDRSSGRRCTWECAKKIAPALGSRPTASKKAGRENAREPRISKRESRPEQWANGAVGAGAVGGVRAFKISFVVDRNWGSTKWGSRVMGRVNFICHVD